MTVLIPPVPTPVPQASDPLNFDERADAHIRYQVGAVEAQNAQHLDNNRMHAEMAAFAAMAPGATLDAQTAKEAAAASASIASGLMNLALAAPDRRGEIFWSASPFVTDGSKVSDVVYNAAVVGSVYHVVDWTARAAVFLSNPASVVLGSGLVSVHDSSGVETVYVEDGCLGLLDDLRVGQDVIYLRGPSTDYTFDTATTFGMIWIYKRLPDGRLSGARVRNGSTADGKDKVVFGNGWAITDQISAALNVGTAVAGILATDQTTPAVYPAVAPIINGPVPNNWLFADGRVVPRSFWPGVFGQLGTRYGAGNGVTTFALPAVDTQSKTVTPSSGCAGVFAYIHGF